MSPARPRPGRLRGAAAALTAAAAALAGTALTLAPAASAAPPGPNDPRGRVTGVQAVADGLRVTGWAFDPDAPTSNVNIAVVLDGYTRPGLTPTSLPNATVTKTYRTGPTPGFQLTTPVPAGPHTVCIVARTIGAGLDTVLRCIPLPLGTVLSAAQVAAHSPRGALTAASVTSSTFRVQGWATDPDVVYRRSLVVLYLDGQPAATVPTHSYPLPRPAGAGRRSAYDITVPVASGTHVGCVWVVNVGIGSNTFQGCRTLDTRGPAGTGALTTPALNSKVVPLALKQIGKPYVWGAVGPKAFDCSGLVQWTYARNGYVTPRISEDQRVAARLIPASRAVPGDLVFYHDTVGDVYHVGIYLSPGKTVAAIDPAEGVAYQSIWDPSSTTYGSFTHT